MPKETWNTIVYLLSGRDRWFFITNTKPMANHHGPRYNTYRKSAILLMRLGEPTRGKMTRTAHRLITGQISLLGRYPWRTRKAKAATWRETQSSGHSSTKHHLPAESCALATPSLKPDWSSREGSCEVLGFSFPCRIVLFPEITFTHALTLLSTPEPTKARSSRPQDDNYSASLPLKNSVRSKIS